MSYRSAHRYLLRTVSSRGVISLRDMVRLLADHTDNETSSVQDMVQDVNDMIRPFQQKIKVSHDEIKDEEVLVFMSLADDEISKAQSFFSASELEYFRVLLEQIITADSRQITRIHALNLVGSMKSSFTKTEAEKLLNTWCNMRYLEKDNTNFILGLRTIHEFEGYFRQNMPDVVEECCLCKTIVFRGYNCPACALAVHTRCLNRYIKNVQKWPCCKVDYNIQQLEMYNNDSSRLSQTQRLDNTQATQENDVTEIENHATQDTMDDVTQEVIPEISQRITRKRKFNSRY